MKARLIIICCLFISGSLCGYAQTPTDSLLAKLNAVLAKKDVFVNKKLARIETLNKKLSRTHDPKKEYVLYDQLFDEYKNFSYDSAYTYAKKLERTANQLKNPSLLASAKMKLSFTLISSGMFKETLETLNRIDVNLFTDSNKIEYYALKGRSYLDLSDFDHNNDYFAIYNPLGIKYIDSALALCKPGTYNYLYLNGLKNLRISNYPEGIKDYNRALNLPHLTLHQYAVNACSLSYMYQVDGRQDMAVALLIKAAIADIRSATKETVAMYQLASYLYKKGDEAHAYVYINQAMDDAIFYGARHRQVTISNILPIIEAQRINAVEQQRRSLIIYASIITVLIIAVVFFAIIIFRQLKKLRIADNLIKEANISLQQNNKALEELNKNLSTANKIKNEYIGYYFNINTIYIEKLESFQVSLEKKLNSKRYDDAHAAVKNLNLESERQELFHTFDKVFLRLFPDFINKFNALFSSGSEIFIPEGQLLSTEHRIFALIRMGIHDNDRIARLLGYSVNTIYSYKNRIKNKSFVANDEFDDRIMAIEAV